MILIRKSLKRLSAYMRPKEGDVTESSVDPDSTVPSLGLRGLLRPSCPST